VTISTADLALGAGTLTKAGAGTLTLSGANTYAGATTVSNGVLAISHAAALGTDAAGTTVADGAELRVLGGITVATEALTLNGTGLSSNGALRNISGNNTIGGAITLSTTSKIVATAGTLTISGGVTGTDTNLTIGGAGNVTINGSGLSLGTGSLTKSGSGLLLLNVANTYSGGTTISGGILKIADAGALGSGMVSVGSAGTLNLNNLTIANAITLAADATLTGGSLPITSVPMTGRVDVVLTGSSQFTKTDAGELKLTGANTYTAPTQVSAGKLTVTDLGDGSHASSVGITDVSDPTKLVVSSGAVLNVESSNTQTTDRSLTLAAGAALASSGTGAVKFTSTAQVALAGASPTLNLSGTGSGDNTFGASLAAGTNPIAVVAKDGVGTWVLSGAKNRFKGDVRLEVAGGTIGLGNDALPATATIAISNTAPVTVRWESGNTSDLSTNLNLAAGAAATLNMSGDVALASPITFPSGAAVALTKAGSGTMTLSADNSNFTGTFTQAAGTTDVTNAKALGSAAVSVSGGRIAINASITNAVSVGNGGTIGGSGSVGAVSVGNGGILSPGNSPGTLTTASSTMSGGSTFQWQVQDATDSAKYDHLNVTGTLDLSGASSGNRITFKIMAIDGTLGGSTFGPPDNFSSHTVRTFNIGTVGTLNLGSNASISDVFSFDVSSFVYSEGTGSNAGLWSLDYNSGSGAITLTAVPEPSTYGLGIGALALAVAAYRRRRQLKKTATTP
ncbi:MAG: autotransporter-associated beta strand repeat-containing protein, partial [Rhodospirillales bacterium]